MEEDWGINASAPKFSLFKDSTPEEEAKKEGFVDTVIYNRWKKAERRLYQRLKIAQIARAIHEEKLSTMDDLSIALDSLSLLKQDAPQPDPSIDDLIDQVHKLQIKTKMRG